MANTFSLKWSPVTEFSSMADVHRCSAAAWWRESNPGTSWKYGFCSGDRWNTVSQMRTEKRLWESREPDLPDHQQPCHGAGGYLRIPGGDWHPPCEGSKRACRRATPPEAEYSGIPPFQGIPRKSYGASESRQERYANRILINVVNNCNSSALRLNCIKIIVKNAEFFPFFIGTFPQ